MSIFDEFEYEAPDPASHDPRNKAFDILKREDITLLEGESVIGRNLFPLPPARINAFMFTILFSYFKTI